MVGPLRRINPVKIKRNTNGDTRVATHVPTIEEFFKANYTHTEDVKNIAGLFAQILGYSVSDHDWTKRNEPYRSMFYRDMAAAMEHGKNFTDGEWAKLHYYELERHHLNRHCPEDVDLFDVIEMICDCIAAGMARSGEVRDIEISPEVLSKSIKNTVEILKKYIELED